MHFLSLDITKIAEVGPEGLDGKEIRPGSNFGRVIPFARMSEKDFRLEKSIDQTCKTSCIHPSSRNNVFCIMVTWPVLVQTCLREKLVLAGLRLPPLLQFEECS